MIRLRYNIELFLFFLCKKDIFSLIYKVTDFMQFESNLPKLSVNLS